MSCQMMYRPGEKDMRFTRDELVARLIKAGELEVLGGDQAEIDSYFDTEQFRFHAPDGFETDYAELANYFKSVRAIDQSVGASSSSKATTSPAKPGSRDGLLAPWRPPAAWHSAVVPFVCAARRARITLRLPASMT
jgi:hypothetical protein